MTVQPAARDFGLQARMAALQARHAELDARISDEQRRPLPDSARLMALKRRKLRLRDAIARYEGLLRALSAMRRRTETAG